MTRAQRKLDNCVAAAAASRVAAMFASTTAAIIIAGAAAIVPLNVHALGLGEARVESFLNQPLDVRMRLLDVSDADLDSLTVRPASPEDFERLGLASGSLALGLEINVDRSVSPPIVRVTSERPVSDPVVQLLVDARWASGRMLREYTLFLDPPTVAVEAPAPARTQPSAPPTISPASDDAEDGSLDDSSAAPPARPMPRSRPAPEAPPVAASSARSYGPVASGDTLWSIASANLPAGNITMNQMMIAIVELNPEAFRDRNVNQLLRGAQLELPDAERASALDAAAAAAEVAAQNRAFRRGMTADVPVVSSAGRDSVPEAEAPAAGPTSGRPEETESADAEDHRLSLVPPGEDESATGLSEDAGEVAELRQRLARAEEELYAARQEAEEFQARVENLENLVEQNPDGIGLRDAELADLEATLRAAREATREDADPELRAEVSERLESYLEEYEAASPDAAEGDGEAGDAGPEADTAETDADEAPETPPPGPDEAAEAEEGAPARTVTEIQTSRGLFSNPVVLILAGLAVLLVALVVVGLALRGRRAVAEPKKPLKRASEVSPAERPAKDPITAARAQVDENPDDLAAHLGLLQTLAIDGKESEFSDALSEMYAHVASDSSPEWREALNLAGRVVPGHSLVKGSSDWVSETPQADDDASVSEVDEESEVDDLMTRLDADLDESDADDREWLGEEDTRSNEPDAPLLRGGESTDTVSVPADPAKESSASSPASIDAEDDEGIDFGAWGDEDESTAPKDAEAEPEAGEGDNDDIFAQSDDDVDVKLDLAKAYLSWNSTDSARTLLEEVAREGNESQQDEARKLLDDTSDESDN